MLQILQFHLELRRTVQVDPFLYDDGVVWADEVVWGVFSVADVAVEVLVSGEVAVVLVPSLLDQHLYQDLLVIQ